MFQYAAARNLAQNKNLYLKVDGIDGFANTFKVVDGKKFFLRRQIQRGHILKPIKPRSQVIFDGLFQRHEYLPEIEVLREWFSCPDSDFALGSNDLALSIRRGWNGYPIDKCPGIDFYIELISKIEFHNLYLFSDSLKDEFFAPIKKAFPKIIFAEGNALTQFRLLKTAKKMVMAHSTFTYWAGLLGNAEKIYLPKHPSFNFAGTDIDWFPIGDSRFEQIAIS